ncbi:MAG: alpha-L-rhamnosidase C-terminal domain-containing protein, partial [Kiritimatiellia bacterium]|nr:hypothetical protein [Lentisphaerota bacterium]
GPGDAFQDAPAVDPFENVGVFDPDPAKLALFAEPGAGACWLYEPGELEAWFFNRLRHDSFKACLHVAHPGAFRSGCPILYAVREWRLDCMPDAARIRVAACGHLHITLNGHVILHVAAVPRPEPVNLDILPWLRQGDNRFFVRVHSVSAPPTLLMEGQINSDPAWTVSTDACRYGPPHPVACVGTDRFPHEERLPEVELAPISLGNGVWDFGVEVFGRPEAQVRGAGTLAFHPGESEAEARNEDAVHHEQYVTELMPGAGCVVSPVELAMRYLRVAASPGLQVESIRLRASTFPVSYRGSFSSDDPMLDRIWRQAAYTLRLCMREIFVDGIKRDRLPWVGDLYLAGLANAFVFFDAGIMRRSLVALYGADPEGLDFNGIIDYSFFWIMALHDYVMHFGDLEFLARQRPQLERLLRALENRRDHTDMIPSAACRWLFIDWADIDKTGYSACLEFLSIRALTAAAQLFGWLGDQMAAEHWGNIAMRRRDSARSLFWSEEAGAFRDCSGSARIGRHANLLAVLAGVATDGQRKSLVENVLMNQAVPAVGTPYMRSLEVSALAGCGQRAAMLEVVRNYWGGMLRAGATSFWERYNSDAGADDHLAMYNRPYGASLCHAWSTGPVFLLIRELFGLEPLAPGWSRFALQPAGCGLRSIKADVPTPHGTIRLKQDMRELSVEIPAGVVVEHAGRAITGPGRLVCAVA